MPQFSWSATAKPKGYRQLLQLIGHEYHGKCGGGRELRPYDYGQAVITEALVC